MAAGHSASTPRVTTGRDHIVNIKSKRLATASLAGALVVGIGGAVAAAAVPEADGVINGCYSTKGSLFGSPKGSLRVIDEGEMCRSSERALPWNQQGPQGEKGDPGLQGPTGPPGPAVAPQAKLAAGTAPVYLTDGTPHTALSIALPAGTWALTAKAEANSGRDAWMDITCDLMNGETVLDRVGTYSNARTTGVPLALVAIVTVPASGTVDLTCRSSEAGARVDRVKILATAVS